MNVSELADNLAGVMARQLRLRGGSLADVTARAGRKLPKHLRAEAQTIIDAQTQAEHPKFAHRVDAKRLKKAERKLMTHLGKQNPKAERRAEFLDRLAFIVFVVFVVILGVFFLMLSRGYFS